MRHYSYRGVLNVSKFSCHVACAIQILCHAIPTVRTVLLRIIAAEEEEEEEENDDDDDDDDYVNEQNDLVIRELLDFVRVSTRSDDKNQWKSINGLESINDLDNRYKFPSPWNPHRLYTYLQQINDDATGELDPASVGDATDALIFLFQLLSKESNGTGVWKDILNVSIWEGETQQILEGRRVISAVSDSATSASTTILQRIKKSTKNKSMTSPLVLKFRYNINNNHDASRHRQQKQQHENTDDGTSKTAWSIIKALNEVFQPQIIQGSGYPWKKISPDLYSEQEIIFPDDSSHYTINNSREYDSINDKNNDDSKWVTTKRVEIQRIPRVWLLHLDRPRFSIQRFRRSLLEFLTQDSHARNKMHGDKQDSSSSILFNYDHIHTPLILNTTNISGTKQGENEYNKSFHCEQDHLSHSPTFLILQGAIVQVIEIDDDDNDDNENEEEWECGHSITLLRMNEYSWLSIDDGECQLIQECEAIRMISGCCINCNSVDSENQYAYYAASLLVYSIPQDANHYDEEWKMHEDEIIKYWKDKKNKDKRPLILIGKRIKVKWSKGKYYTGTVTSFDRLTGKHCVSYDDGDIKEYILAKKTFDWINDDKS